MVRVFWNRSPDPFCNRPGSVAWSEHMPCACTRLKPVFDYVWPVRLPGIRNAIDRRLKRHWPAVDPCWLFCVLTHFSFLFFFVYFILSWIVILLMIFVSMKRLCPSLIRVDFLTFARFNPFFVPFFCIFLFYFILNCYFANDFCFGEICWKNRKFGTSKLLLLFVFWYELFRCSFSNILFLRIIPTCHLILLLFSHIFKSIKKIQI